MTPAELEDMAERAGGPRALAKRLGMGKDWVYRRLNGDARITPVDEVALRAAMKSRTRKKVR